MDQSPRPPLLVEKAVLPDVHVAYIRYTVVSGQSNFASINACFGRVRDWLRRRGLQPSAFLTIGASRFEGTPPVYDCCVQVPQDIEHGDGEVQIQDLPGGRYAVLSIRKEPAIIGETLRRFYHEYVPQNKLKIDAGRLTYEIYDESAMRYCVPLMEV